VATGGRLARTGGAASTTAGLIDVASVPFVERPSATITIRAILALALLVGFYVVGLGTLVVLAGLSVWLWWVVPGEVAHEVSLAMLVVALGLVVPAWRVMRARPVPPPGTPVTEDQAPELWSLVRELAALVDTRAPDEIRLAVEVNAGVWDDAGLVGLRPSRRYLYIGIPILEWFTAAQVRAVLAHEMGHYARGHTRLGALTYRGMRSIAGTISQLRSHTLAGAAMTGYGMVYALVAMAVMRHMEVEADRVAARTVGRKAFVQALRELPRLATAWDAYVDGYVGWIQQRGYLPEEFLAYFHALVQQRSPQLERVPAWLAPPPQSPWDSHPPLDERIALLERVADCPVEVDQRSGLALVNDLDVRSATLCTSAFDEYVATIAHKEAHHAAKALYYRAGRLAGTRSAGLGTVLDLLAQGRAGALNAAGNLAEYVLAAVNATLVISAGARWRHVWSAPLALVSRDGDPILARPLIDLACRDPLAVAGLREFLHELGVPGVVTTDLPQRWGDALGTGPLSENDQLLLADELYMIALQVGQRRIPGDVLAAGLAAAVLSELRLLGRIEVADTAEASLHASDISPTGDRFLDAVLRRVRQAGAHPAYQWLQMLGPDVSDAVYRRLSRHGAATVPIVDTTRSRLVQALRHGDLQGRDVALGALLWGTELAGPVLGRSLWTRFWLGRVAHRDRLAIAIRIIIGIHMPTPSIGR
jgi:Zn-dependent protease with chaperone function